MFWCPLEVLPHIVKILTPTPFKTSLEGLKEVDPVLLPSLAVAQHQQFS